MAAKPMMMPKTTFVPPVIGHRGACGHAPENTLVSFRRAAALGVRWVEFDVSLSRDREVVVLHDEGLERTTNGGGLVAEKDWAELQAFDAGAWYDEEFSGARIPSLGQAISVLAELGLGANIEIKPGPGQSDETGRITAARLRAEWPVTLPPPVISSFDSESLKAARNTAPDIPRALVVSNFPRIGAIGLPRSVVPRCTAITNISRLAKQVKYLTPASRSDALPSTGPRAPQRSSAGASRR